MTAGGRGRDGGAVCTEQQEYKRDGRLTYWKAKWWDKVGVGHGWGGSVYQRHLGGSSNPSPPPRPVPLPRSRLEAERRTFGSGRAPLHEAAPPQLNKSQRAQSIPDHRC